MVLDSVARAVANWTVDAHLKLHPELASHYGNAWRSDWVGHTLSQLALLAQSTAVRSAELFAQSVRWNHESFIARGVNSADLLRNMTCLRGVLAKELPANAASFCLPLLDRAMEWRRGDFEIFGAGAHQDPEHHGRMLQYLRAILEGNRATAESVIRKARDDGATVPAIYEQVLAPAQARLGTMWHRGEISVADEHIGSATTQTVMSQLRLSFQRPASRGRSMVGTATAGDLHEIGLRMVTDLFELDGWDVTYIGANTPNDDVIELLSRKQTDLLALSVSTALTLREAGELIERIRESSQISSVKIMVGGPPFRQVTDLWRELGADGCALTATSAVEEGNRLAESRS